MYQCRAHKPTYLQCVLVTCKTILNAQDTRTHIHICTHTHTYTHIHIHTCTHTHIRTHTPVHLLTLHVHNVHAFLTRRDEVERVPSSCGPLGMEARTLTAALPTDTLRTCTPSPLDQPPLLGRLSTTTRSVRQRWPSSLCIPLVDLCKWYVCSCVCM